MWCSLCFAQDRILSVFVMSSDGQYSFQCCVFCPDIGFFHDSTLPSHQIKQEVLEEELSFSDWLCEVVGIPELLCCKDTKIIVVIIIKEIK